MSQSGTEARASHTRWSRIAWLLAALAMLPLFGVLVAGRSIEPYLEFPPITHSVIHQPFSWGVFTALGVVIVSVMVLGVVRGLYTKGSVSSSLALSNPVGGVFPWWGWLAVGWTLLAWSLAWSRFEWMRPFQSLTFTPLWLGYIVTMNGLTFRRIGRCMMLHRPLYFLSLFPLSALFWWSFEYLNRFVQNWYYLGGSELTAWEYVWQATLPFSTVLPAVLGTAEWLTTYQRPMVHSDQLKVLANGDRAGRGWGLLCGAATGLLGLGLWPDFLFSLVWVAPLLLITAMQWIRGESSIFDNTPHGDWRSLWSVAFAALICGFFWELWNFYSLAHWEYAVPFVHRFELFHMPLLGYAGYLPFGLECLAVADLCLSRKFSGGAAYYGARGGGTDLAQRNPTLAER